jgi:outer membrane lipoprotein-sorting protein
MLQIVFVIAVILLFNTSCIQAEKLPTPVLSPDNSSSEEAVDMSEEFLSPKLQQAILKAVGVEKTLPPESLNIVKSEAADWPDACLGLSGPDEFCAQMMTPGWSVSVTDGQQTWQYRTDLDVTQVRQETSE